MSRRRPKMGAQQPEIVPVGADLEKEKAPVNVLRRQSYGPSAHRKTKGCPTSDGIARSLVGESNQNRVELAWLNFGRCHAEVERVPMGRAPFQSYAVGKHTNLRRLGGNALEGRPWPG